MPRNSGGVYSLPPNTAAVSGQPAASAKVNLIHSDLEADANAPRPPTAGGTGADNVNDARDNLEVDHWVTLSAHSGAYTALATDNNGVIRFTAAATLSLTAADTLGADWHCTVIAGNGIVIVDPNGSEQINGATVLVIPSNYSASIICDGTAFRVTSLAPIAEAATTLPLSNYLSGYTLSNNGSDATNDIDVSAGSCTNTTNAAILTRTSAITKRLDALWTVGTNQGGLDTGSVTNTTYHVFAIKRLDTGVVDILFSASATAPTLPANYTVFRRIGSIIRASGAILGFTQSGDEFLLKDPALDVDVTQSAFAVTRTLNVPTGIAVEAMFRALCNNAAFDWSIIFASLTTNDTAPALSAAPLCDLSGAISARGAGSFRVRTNTSGEIRSRANAGSTTLRISTYGWIDGRGK